LKFSSVMLCTVSLLLTSLIFAKLPAGSAWEGAGVVSSSIALLREVSVADLGLVGASGVLWARDADSSASIASPD
jgi:hypothetical protein